MREVQIFYRFWAADKSGMKKVGILAWLTFYCFELIFRYITEFFTNVHDIVI